MKLLMKPAQEGGMSVKQLMEFRCVYDDIEKTSNEIINEFMNDTYEKINPLSDIEIHTHKQSRTSKMQSRWREE